MWGASAINERGHWEPRKANSLNLAILHRHGISPLDPSLHLQEEGAFDPEKNAGWIAKIRTYLTTLPAAPLVVISLLSGVWFEAAHLAGFDVAAVIAVRHPQEVSASLGAGGPYSLAFPSTTWLKYTLLAERGTRAVPRVFVEYANLLENWRRETKWISTALAIDLNTGDEGAVDEFLTPSLRHQRDCGAVTEPFGTDWMSAVYETLGAAARDEPWDASVLDRVFEAYRASEHGFRTAFEDFHQFEKRYRLIGPSIRMLIAEVSAIAHRRRGTWA